MGKIGTCCCSCCMPAEEMPYSSATLRSPIDPCGPGGTIPQNPTYKTSPFTRFGCCYEASFSFQCMPTVFNCAIWAKREIDISFDATQYGILNIFANAGDNPDNFNCSPIPIQKGSVTFNGVARVFFLQSIRLDSITVKVGKMLTQCEGDETPVCRYFISSTYLYEISEGASQVQNHVNISITCTGLYDSPNCSVSSTYNIQEGTDSDTCPFTTCENCTEFSTLEITRIRFFDVLPELNTDVSITAQDDATFDCCDGKTNCSIVETACGISIGSNCIQPVPNYDEFMNIMGPLIPGCQSELPGILSYNPNTDSWECPFVVQVVPPSFALVDIFYSDGFCWFKEATCDTLTVGEDELYLQMYDEEGNPSYQQLIDMCGTLGQVVPNSGEDPGSPHNLVNCFGGEDPPLPGLCVNDKNCCEISGNQILTYPCNKIGSFGGAKITNFTCSHNRTDYSNVGGTCISLPTVTLRFA